MNEKVKRAMSLFIILIMVASGIGYAFSFSFFSGTPAAQNQQQTAEEVFKRIVGNGTVEKELQPSEKAFVLQYGLVLLEMSAPEECFRACPAETTCLPCQEHLRALEGFRSKYGGSIVFEKIRSDNMTARFISSSGKPSVITDFGQENLLDTYCRIATYAPRECLLRNILRPNETVSGNQT